MALRNYLYAKHQDKNQSILINKAASQDRENSCHQTPVEETPRSCKNCPDCPSKAQARELASDAPQVSIEVGKELPSRIDRMALNEVDFTNK